MKRAILTVLIAAVCGSPSIAHEYRSVTWFADHPAEMREVLKLCRDNPGLAPHNPNCINADEAGTLILQRQLDAAANGHPSPGLRRYGLTP
jgi:hypothetical protein